MCSSLTIQCNPLSLENRITIYAAAYSETQEEFVNRERERGEEQVKRDTGSATNEWPRRKPTMKLCSSAPDRTICESRCRDLIGQPIEVSTGWEPHVRSHARMTFAERSEVVDACVP